jgi:hypothetical protein
MKKIISCFFGLVLLIHIISGCASLDEEAYKDRGNEYLKKKDYDKALIEYTKALEINPNYYLVINAIGTVYYEKGDFDLALKHYNRAIKLDPNDYRAISNRGLVYHAQKKYDLALQDFKQGLKLAPNNTQLTKLIQATDQKIAETTQGQSTNAPRQSASVPGRTAGTLQYPFLGKKWTATNDERTLIYEFSSDGKSYTFTSIPKAGKKTKTDYKILELETRKSARNTNYVVYARDPKKGPDHNFYSSYHTNLLGKINMHFGVDIIDEHTIQFVGAIHDESILFYDIDPAEAKRLAEIKAKAEEDAKAKAQAEAQAKAREEKRLAEVKSKEQEAARAKAEAEARAANEQLRKVIKISGSYVSVGNGSWRAIRFYDNGYIYAWVIASRVSRDGPRETTQHLFPCAVVDGQVQIYNDMFSVSNNGDLQMTSDSGVTNIWRFVPHIPVQGKAFSRVHGSGDRGYGFRGSQLLIENRSGALIDDKAYSYKYEDGKVTVMYNGNTINLLTVIGPYITDVSGGIWQLE